MLADFDLKMFLKKEKNSILPEITQFCVPWGFKLAKSI